MDYLYDVSKSIKDLRDTELEIIAKDIKKDKTMAFIAACLIEIRNTNYIQTKTQSNCTPKTHFLNILQK